MTEEEGTSTHSGTRSPHPHPPPRRVRRRLTMARVWVAVAGDCPDLPGARQYPYCGIFLAARGPCPVPDAYVVVILLRTLIGELADPVRHPPDLDAETLDRLRTPPPPAPDGPHIVFSARNCIEGPARLASAGGLASQHAPADDAPLERPHLPRVARHRTRVTPPRSGAK